MGPAARLTSPATVPPATPPASAARTRHGTRADAEPDRPLLTTSVPALMAAGPVEVTLA